jgi:concanavalin A-like lectin/glucanase superfamily protein
MNSRLMTNGCVVFALVVMLAQAGNGAELLGHWDFNEEAGARVTDRSGHGHHGTIHGAPKREPGVAGEALRFAMPADFVDFGAAIIPAQDFTISVWINCDDTEKQFFLGQYLYAHPSRLDLAVREGCVRIQVDELVDSSKLVRAHQWHHVAYTRAGEQVKIYLDGKVITQAKLPSPVLQTEPLMVGKIVVPEQDSFRFTGLMDELKIWDAALDEAEVNEVNQKLKR